MIVTRPLTVVEMATDTHLRGPGALPAVAIRGIAGWESVRSSRTQSLTRPGQHGRMRPTFGPSRMGPPTGVLSVLHGPRSAANHVDSKEDRP